MKTPVAISLVLLVAGFTACRNASTNIVEVSHPKYHAGQIWKYRTRLGEESSRATILRIDKTPKVGFIIHIAVDGLSVKSPTSANGIAKTISHLPFAESAMDQSLTELERIGGVPDFSDGYKTWRTSFDQNKAGFWTVPVAEAVTAMEAALSGAK
jgi:hypothetical protein